jgi:hypothetical protein
VVVGRVVTTGVVLAVLMQAREIHLNARRHAIAPTMSAASTKHVFRLQQVAKTIPIVPWVSVATPTAPVSRCPREVVPRPLIVNRASNAKKVPANPARTVPARTMRVV